MTEAEMIVKDLAERSPGDGDSAAEQCVFCYGVAASYRSQITEPRWHDPSCLWLRAVELVSHLGKPHPGWKEGEALRFGADEVDMDAEISEGE